MTNWQTVTVKKSPGVDLDRGCYMRALENYAEVGLSGPISVWMYADELGIYYDSHGRELPEAVAAAAGFDTTRFRDERLKRERIAAVKAEMEVGPERGEELARNDSGYLLLKIGPDRAVIRNGEGEVLVGPDALSVLQKYWRSVFADPAEK